MMNALYKSQRLTGIYLRFEQESTLKGKEAFFYFMSTVFTNQINEYHMHLDRQARADSVDPDETPQNAAIIRVYTVCHSSSNV